MEKFIRRYLDFVLKPKHSAFYSTPLDILLNHLDAEKLILAGFAGNICVLFTANDAYMRNFKLIIPKDCIGSNTAEVNLFSFEVCFIFYLGIGKRCLSRTNDQIIKSRYPTIS